MIDARRPANRRAALLVALAALSGTWAQAFAQDQPLEEPPEPMPARWRLGPVRLQPFAGFRDLGYDSNVFLAAEGEETSDLTGRIVAGARGEMWIARRGLLRFEARPEGVIFARHPDLNFLGHTLEARGDLFVGEVSLFAGGRWSSDRTRAISEIDDRTRVRLSHLSAGAGWRSSSRLSFSVVAEELAYRHTDPALGVLGADDCPGGTSVGDFLDRDERSLTARATYRAFPRTRLFVEASRGEFEFDRCGARDSRRTAWMPGVIFDPHGTLSGSIKIGRARFDSRRPGRPDFSGGLGEAELVLRPSGDWRISTEWERRVEHSVLLNNLYTIGVLKALGVSRAVGDRFAVEAGRSVDDLLWPDSICVRLATTGGCAERARREDRIIETFLGTRIRMAARSVLVVRLGHRQKTSSFAGLEDRQFTLFTSLER